MPRQPHSFQPDYCYHITTRCNNHEFRLSLSECWEVFLYAIKKAFDKFNFNRTYAEATENRTTEAQRSRRNKSLRGFLRKSYLNFMPCA